MFTPKKQSVPVMPDAPRKTKLRTPSKALKDALERSENSKAPPAPTKTNRRYASPEPSRVKDECPYAPRKGKE